MRVLVTGTEGYIGARLAPILSAHGHDVIGLDAGFYREGTLYTDLRQMPTSPRTVYKDVRSIEAADFADCDAVVHLAELSNDPLGQLNPEITYDLAIATRKDIIMATGRSDYPSCATTTICRPPSSMWRATR